MKPWDRPKGKRRRITLISGFGGAKRAGPSPSDFVPFSIDFSDQTAESAPSEGAVPDTCVAPVVKTNMVDGGGNTLAPTIENRTCYFAHNQNPPVAWGWDLRDYGNGLDAPAAGWRVEIYMYGAAPYITDSRNDAIEFYLGNIKTTWPTASLGDNVLHIPVSFQITKARIRIRSIIDTTLTTYDDTDTLATTAYYWQRVRIEFDGVARTVQCTSMNVNTSVLATGGEPTLPAEGTWPFPDWRYLTIAAHINTDSASIGLQSVWVGNLTDDWPAARTVV